MSAPTKTANGMFNYNEVYGNRKLSEWADICHRELSRESKWKYIPLKPGSFGFDNMIMSIGYLFENFTENTIEHLADLIHQGWAINYIYWRDNKPKSPYISPAKALGDKRRNDCAIIGYQNLPDDEKDKDRIIARTLMKYCDFTIEYE